MFWLVEPKPSPVTIQTDMIIYIMRKSTKPEDLGEEENNEYFTIYKFEEIKNGYFLFYKI